MKTWMLALAATLVAGTATAADLLPDKKAVKTLQKVVTGGDYTREAIAARAGKHLGVGFVADEDFEAELAKLTFDRVELIGVGLEGAAFEGGEATGGFRMSWLIPPSGPVIGEINERYVSVDKPPGALPKKVGALKATAGAVVEEAQAGCNDLNLMTVAHLDEMNLVPDLKEMLRRDIERNPTRVPQECAEIASEAKGEVHAVTVAALFFLRDGDDLAGFGAFLLQPADDGSGWELEVENIDSPR